MVSEEEYLEGKKLEYKAYNEEDEQEKGEGKEYYGNNELIYEGEYLNRKRHGRGKEYRLGKLIFKGEYINGKRWNGYAYDNQGNIIYELKNVKRFSKRIWWK